MSKAITLELFPVPNHIDCCDVCGYTEGRFIIVFGCYEINADRKRSGGLLTCLFTPPAQIHWVCPESICSTTPIMYNTPCAILDIHMYGSNEEGQYIACAIGSDGHVHIYSLVLNADATMVYIVESCHFGSPVNESVLGLSIDIKRAGNCTSYLWGSSSGAISVLNTPLDIFEHNPESINANDMMTNAKAHQGEVWTVAYHLGKQIYASGADDAFLKLWDPRQTGEVEAKQHPMGVTSLLFFPRSDNLLFSGSYDEHIRLWDLRMIKNALVEKSTDGGGIWRLKHVQAPDGSELIIVAAMHGGSYVYRVDLTESRIDLILHHKPTDNNLIYTVCALPQHTGGNPIYMSSSFYEKICWLWGGS